MTIKTTCFFVSFVYVLSVLGSKCFLDLKNLILLLQSRGETNLGATRLVYQTL